MAGYQRSQMARWALLFFDLCVRFCFTSQFYCRTMLCKRGLCHHAVSVCPFVMFVHSVKTNKDIFGILSPLGSHTILFFPYKTSWQIGNIPTGTPLTGASNAGGVGYIWLHCILLTLRLARCYQYDAVSASVALPMALYKYDMIWNASRKLWHFAGSKRQCLLTAGKDGEMFITRSFNVTPKTTEQHLIVCSDKSVAYVTNNRRLCSTFCTIEANYWQTRSIAWPLCDSKASCHTYRGLSRVLVSYRGFVVKTFVVAKMAFLPSGYLYWCSASSLNTRL